MKRAIVLVISVILALTMAAPTVLAQSDNGVAPGPSPSSGTFTVNPDNPGGHCSFPLQLEVSGKGKTITQPDGSRILTSPGLDVTATNPQNGEQARFSITGTFFETTAENGDVTTVITGRNLLFDPDAGIVLLSGNFSFVFDAEGNLIKSFEDPPAGNGQVIDVCALLA
jgi:hypothetical protein